MDAISLFPEVAWNTKEIVPGELEALVINIKPKAGTKLSHSANRTTPDGTLQLVFMVNKEHKPPA